MPTRYSKAPAWKQMRIFGTIMLVIGLVLTVVARLTAASFLVRLGPGLIGTAALILIPSLVMWLVGRQRQSGAGD